MLYLKILNFITYSLQTKEHFSSDSASKCSNICSLVYSSRSLKLLIAIIYFTCNLFDLRYIRYFIFSLMYDLYLPVCFCSLNLRRQERKRRRGIFKNPDSMYLSDSINI